MNRTLRVTYAAAAPASTTAVTIPNASHPAEDPPSGFLAGGSSGRDSLGGVFSGGGDFHGRPTGRPVGFFAGGVQPPRPLKGAFPARGSGASAEAGGETSAAGVGFLGSA